MSKICSSVQSVGIFTCKNYNVFATNEILSTDITKFDKNLFFMSYF